jgi:hypothetical protein
MMPLSHVGLGILITNEILSRPGHNPERYTHVSIYTEKSNYIHAMKDFTEQHYDSAVDITINLELHPCK